MLTKFELGGIIYLDDDTAAADHLAGFSLTVDLAQPDPLTELLVIVNLQYKFK